MAKKPVRVKGGKKVDEFVEQVTGVTITVHLVTDSMTFVASVLGKRFRDKEGDKARSAAIKYARDMHELVYKPVIIVSERRPWFHYDDASVAFDLEREYITQKADGEWVSIEWSRYVDGDSKENALRSHPTHNGSHEFPYTRKADRDSVVTVIEYDEALWTGLKELQNKVRLLRERLFQMIGSPDGINTITQVGESILKMLPAAVEDDPQT